MTLILSNKWPSLLGTKTKRVAREELGKIIAKKETCWRLPKRMSNPLLKRGSGEMEAFSTGIPCSKEERFGGKVGKNWKHHTCLPKKREPFTPGPGKRK